MGFKFEILHISRLEKAGVVVMDGGLREGSVTVGISAELIHEGRHLPIYIKGVVLGSVRSGADVLSLTVDQREEAMSLASIGDWIVSKNEA